MNLCKDCEHLETSWFNRLFNCFFSPTCSCKISTYIDRVNGNIEYDSCGEARIKFRWGERLADYDNCPKFESKGEK